MGFRYTIEDMQLLASDHDGKCLSKEYWNTTTKLSWMCAKGHTFDAFPYAIKQGAWCSQCIRGKTTRLTIEEMQLIAMEKGGKCISAQYVDIKTKLTWQCKEGHLWEAAPGHIKISKSWCPHCSGKAKHTIEQMQELAEKKRGKCLSKVYTNSNTQLLWQCEKGHKWKAKPQKILIGHWCTHYDCRYIGVSKKLRADINELYKLAEKRGGKLLSTEYINSHKKLVWQCAEGHQWKSSAMNVRNAHTWCPICSYKKFKRRNKDSIIIRK